MHFAKTTYNKVIGAKDVITAIVKGLCYKVKFGSLEENFIGGSLDSSL